MIPKLTLDTIAHMGLNRGLRALLWRVGPHALFEHRRARLRTPVRVLCASLDQPRVRIRALDNCVSGNQRRMPYIGLMRCMLT